MKFTIRDVLWLTVVVALATGWWIDHANQSIWQDRAENLASLCEATVGWKVTWKDGLREADIANTAREPRATFLP